jgi:hypothetical protein
MTKPRTITGPQITRAVRALAVAGVQVRAIRLQPDGSVQLFTMDADVPQTDQWADVPLSPEENPWLALRKRRRRVR